MRYDDEGERDQLCHCVIDLEALPSFRMKLEASPLGQFYIGVNILNEILHQLILDLEHRFRSRF